MIGVTNLHFSHGNTAVLKNITLQVAAYEFVALTGPNGAGKTTCLQALAGILPGGKPDARRVAYVEQGASVSWGMMRVRDVVQLGRLPHGDDAAASVARAMRLCGVTTWENRPIAQLSGGESRRVMLARAFAGDPAVLLLDEPVADLDPAAAHNIMQVLAGFAAGGGTVVAVLHALDLACTYANRMVVMQAGKIVADGTPVQTLPMIASVFNMRLAVDSTQRLLPIATTPNPKDGLHGY